MNKFILLILILEIHSSFTMDLKTILNPENAEDIAYPSGDNDGNKVIFNF